MKNNLRALAKSAGANTAIYDREEQVNIVLDHRSAGMIAIIKEINAIELVIEGNGIADRVSVSVAFVKKVDYSDKAVTNAQIMNSCLSACKSFMMKIINGNDYEIVNTPSAVKVKEGKYDANVIGWEIMLSLYLNNGYIEC